MCAVPANRNLPPTQTAHASPWSRLPARSAQSTPSTLGAMQNIVECVPNFSEGRDRSIIDQIVAAIQSVPGVLVMDTTMDPDHHRSVITFAGQKETIGEGALRAIGKAAELIDLNQHSGGHPRIGATDVVPFIPVQNVTMEECVALARQVGAEAARRFSIPVYLYEAAATRPDRVQLENIRRGQFEGLRQEIQASERIPDFGPARIHPSAGATAVGARKFLIAYNINLDCSDVETARHIAKTVRFSGGGLPYVKAMGVDLKARQQAQVSMNLTDFEEMPIHRVFEMVKREADQYGVAIAGSEIVGLVPQRALDISAKHFLKIENFGPELIFENRLNAVLKRSIPLAATGIGDFLDFVCEPATSLGGGSVTALAGALAAALGKMVLGLTLNAKAGEAQASSLQEHLATLETSLAELRSAAERDAHAYSGVLAAQQSAQATESEKQIRGQKLQEAHRHATEVAMQVAEVSYHVLQSLSELRSVVDSQVASDVNVGFWMALAAAEGALETARVNFQAVRESEFISRHTERSQELRGLLKQLCLSNL